MQDTSLPDPARNSPPPAADPAPAPDHADALRARIDTRTATVGVLGLGYVGLPLALHCAEAGFPVIGFDIDPAKVADLNAGRSYIAHIPGSRVAACQGREREGQKAGRLHATTDFGEAGRCDVLAICVPTPLGRHREPDLSYVIRTLESLLPHLRSGQLLSLESTTYPGTTEEELRPRLEACGLRIGEAFFLVHSPEREDPGNRQFDTASIPKLVGGSTPTCLQLGCAFYGAVVKRVVPVSSTRAAEMAKLLENIHRAVNIGLVNEMKMVADRMGIDIHEVIDAAATKPFGFVAYRPGPGLGGHCIPIDPFYLTWKAREYGVNTRFIELAGEVNSGMPQWVVAKVVQALNQRGKAVRGSRILVLGASYKKDIGDTRESPAIEIMVQLEQLGAQVLYHDPHVPELPPMRRYPGLERSSTPLTESVLATQDCLVLATDHAGLEYPWIKTHASLLVDTRGVFRGPDPKIVHA